MYVGEDRELLVGGGAGWDADPTGGEAAFVPGIVGGMRFEGFRVMGANRASSLEENADSYKTLSIIKPQTACKVFMPQTVGRFRWRLSRRPSKMGEEALRHLKWEFVFGHTTWWEQWAHTGR
ncbi:hypothetical protein CRG98_034652 [Punica granatum]|uniref:Uncharacterized protein n=1 Tax=Punica granatum TaxID=22663 RepID=A0A2I0ILT4_PUNGR|nr:hypothetical protein CRG98_034652 [Punica granatum]